MGGFGQARSAGRWSVRTAMLAVAALVAAADFAADARAQGESAPGRPSRERESGSGHLSRRPGGQARPGAGNAG